LADGHGSEMAIAPFRKASYGPSALPGFFLTANPTDLCL